MRKAVGALADDAHHRGNEFQQLRVKGRMRSHSTTFGKPGFNERRPTSHDEEGIRNKAGKPLEPGKRLFKLGDPMSV